MARLVAQLKPKRLLEVGTMIGYSAIVMGKELESDAEIVTVEIDKENAEAARRNIEKAGIKPKVQVIVVTLQMFFQRFEENSIWYF